MFDFGWAELLVVGAIALFVIGPKDIPAIAYQVGKMFRRLKYMQYAVTGQFEDFMKTVEAKHEKSDPEPEKQELDHDPYDEADADAELLDMIPLPEKSKTAIADEQDTPEMQNEAPDLRQQDTSRNAESGAK